MAQELKRYWINCPSIHQPHYDLHRTNVLGYHEYSNTYRVYFLGGCVISQQIHRRWLAEGWIE